MHVFEWWGGLGDAKLIHKYDIVKECLECDFGLNVVAMLVFTRFCG